MPEAIGCIFCTNFHAPIVLQENGYAGKKCSGCSLIYVSPRPTQEEVIDLYGHSNAQVSAQSHITDSLLKRKHARHTLEIISRFKKNGCLLEIGSGGGFFLHQAQKRGYAAYGIELNPFQKDFITTTLQIPCKNEPLCKQSYGDKKFDVIYHCDVLSHFHDPVKEFFTMAHKLQDNGVMVFETGNIGDINKKYYSLFEKFQYPDHLFFFSEQTIKALLEKTGFQLIAIYRYNIVLQLKLLKFLHRYKTNNKNQGTVSTGTPNHSFLKRIVKNSYYALNHVLRYKVGKWLPKKDYPQTLIVVARKL